MPACMAELYGKATGVSRGRGGSMHFFDVGRRLYGGFAIVGGTLPIAVGLALADRMSGRRAVTACFFGDGAVAEGEFHESLNLAALWKLPVLFLCENNLYAMGTALERHQSQTDISRKADAYAMAAEAVDGMDVARRRGSRAARGGARPRGRAPVPARGADVPLPRALDVRPRAVPLEGGGRGVEAPRSHPGAGGAAQRRRAPHPAPSSTPWSCRRRRGRRGGGRRRGSARGSP